jgi:phosphatidylserine decarboxylase
MDTQQVPVRATPEPMPANIPGAQPGGGVCYRIELAWGGWRRWWLRHFRLRYVRHMASRRHGDAAGAPHEILDPRDLKYCRGQCNCSWDEADNRFRWRDRMRFTRWGAAELMLMGGPLLAAAIGLACWRWYLGLVPGALACLVAYFFRDPSRRVPEGPGILVAPADGTVAEITRLDHHDYVGGPAVRIGIFLSIFNVHLNRSPAACRVIALRYTPGEFLNALNPASAIRNENMWIGLEEETPPHRRIVVRQISGAIARRIVCDLRPGEQLGRGQKFGMIKLGSRTELIVPATDDLVVEVKIGQKVKAGTTVFARYRETASGTPSLIPNP